MFRITPRRRRSRRGAVVVLAAVLLVVMVGMIAFAVDVGFITVARTELQGAADAAALAGVSKLPEGVSQARNTAEQYVNLNDTSASSPGITVTPGIWNRDSRQFQPGQSPFDALQVSVNSRQSPLFFGRVFGSNTFNSGASAVAVVRPRDIMLVLDFSGSMNSHNKVDALKEAVALFFDILDEQGDQDRVGYVRYSTNADLEMPLTSDFDRINHEVQKTKATGYTNIGEGIEKGRLELLKNSRPNATRMMVIMTDGHVNRPANRGPREYVLSEAATAAAANIDLYAISFGADADKSLMRLVADAGHDVHFAVDGGVKESERELREVFVKLAMKRKISLVQ